MIAGSWRRTYDLIALDIGLEQNKEQRMLCKPDNQFSILGRGNDERKSGNSKEHGQSLPHR